MKLKANPMPRDYPRYRHNDNDGKREAKADQDGGICRALCGNCATDIGCHTLKCNHV